MSKFKILVVSTVVRGSESGAGISQIVIDFDTKEEATEAAASINTTKPQEYYAKNQAIPLY